ncbi:domain found in IF2B/IF5-domain-containing protein [Kockiozyma suomiensis]|uniref:domain found in IF2B/IF5-domain-containing protein n=1 Tax=Kockiozyma suomiensis TaxID=1337062 RepID=UPI003344279E
MASLEEVTPTVDESLEFDPSLKKKKKKPKAVSFDEAADLDDSAPKNASADPAVDELTDMFANLKKKKKKSTSTASLEPEEGSPAPDTGAEENVEDFDFSTKKKKKKKAAVDVSEFEQQLEEAGVVETNEDDDTFEKDGEEDAEDGEEEEASWLNSDREYTYEELLHRFFKILRTNNPELAGERGQRYKIPPPSVMREGNKKTIFANLKDISDRMHRPYEHVMQFLFAELGTSGSVDGNARLVIKGRFQQKQLENVLRRYIMEYVTCKTCKSISTHLSKENRLYFLVCESCGSRRSVSGIKTGFQAHIGKRKRLPG